jgi:RNA 2',3'-cyclic 3'-phosphodiesterase
MRLFVGIPLTSEVVDVLEALSRTLRRGDENLRWSSPDTWHITLQFLGETPAEKYECVVGKLREIRSPAVPVWLSGTGSFDRAGVFFAGVNVSPELRNLEKQIVAATSQCGFLGEERPYHPHVSLARAKGNDRERALRNLKARTKSDLEFAAFTAREFYLYESFPGSNGARHELRERFPLS